MCIDTVTNLTELLRIDNKTAEHVREKFEHCWLTRYPMPPNCIHDNGGEFNGFVFQGYLKVGESMMCRLPAEILQQMQSMKE
jgi:hypothetical protein